VHTAHWQQLAEMDRDETARRAGCAYLRESDSFVIRLLDEQYRVNMAARSVYKPAEAGEPVPAGFLEELCILTHLASAQDIPLANELVHAEKLDRGGFFFRGSHQLPIEKLAATLGGAPQLLLAVGEILGARTCPFGDASIEVLVLPRIPVTLIIWAGDEEFPARASILFDKSAARQMPLDALYALAKLTIGRTIKLVEKKI